MDNLVHINVVTVDRVRVVSNTVRPLNPMPDGTCRTIKANAAQVSQANFCYRSTYGATGVLVKYEYEKK